MDLIERHGWHVIAELLVLLLTTVVTVMYVTALVRGRVRALICRTCGRVASRSDPRCARCGSALR